MQHMWLPQPRRNERDGLQTSAGSRDGGDPEVTAADLLTWSERSAPTEPTFPNQSVERIFNFWWSFFWACYCCSLARRQDANIDAAPTGYGGKRGGGGEG